MSWYRWGKPKYNDSPVNVPVELEQQYKLYIVTDTETFPVFPIPRSKCSAWANVFCRSGAMLEQEGEPQIFIPARRILEVKFEKLED